MFGIILTSLGSFLSEVSDSIGKDQVFRREQSLYAMGFLQLFFGGLIFLGLAIFKPGAFIFQWASWPTFLVRVILEIVQAHITVSAIAAADRSTFSFIRVGTIPLLLGVDAMLGYTLKGTQLLGFGIITLALLVTFLNHGIKKAGLWFVLASTINAVITISLFKYDITHFNSVVAEQLIIMIIVLGYFIYGAMRRAHENPFKLLRKSLFFTQSFAYGAGEIAQSFAMSFAPASIIIAAKRSSAVLWSLLSGNLYFKEKGLFIKLFIALLLVGGLILLAL